VLVVSRPVLALCEQPFIPMESAIPDSVQISIDKTRLSLLYTEIKGIMI